MDDTPVLLDYSLNIFGLHLLCNPRTNELIANLKVEPLQKGGVPATPSGTATLLRLSPSYWYNPKQRLAAIVFRSSQLPWLDGRCVQGPGTYSPHHC